VLKKPDRLPARCGTAAARTATTLGEELELVRAYLEVMHMRMPDRLKFELHIDETLINIQCPPMTLLTWVENAVRHGIDPSETGGRYCHDVRLESSRCLASVTDTGVGLNAVGRGLGTGLASLRERFAADIRRRGAAHLKRDGSSWRARGSVISCSKGSGVTAQQPNCPDCRGRTAAARVSRTAAIAHMAGTCRGGAGAQRPRSDRSV